MIGTTTIARPAYGATVAAPVTYAAAAPVTMAAPSYVAAPVAAPAAPANFLEGIPDPKTIEQQRAGYEQGLQKQYTDGAAAIKQETALKIKMLQDQAMNSQMMMLQESAMAQRSALEQQAAALTLEYQQKKAEEEMLKKQYEIQKNFCEAENKLATDFNKVVGEEQKAMLEVQQKAAALGVNPGIVGTGTIY